MAHATRILVRPIVTISAAAAIFAGTLAASPQAQNAAKPLPPAATKPVGELTADEETQFSDAAEATIERVCIACHPFENIVKTRRTMREWNDQVTTMAMRGAPGTETDFALIKKYLTRYYGIVRVNTATADELSSVLGLPAKVAAAVVEYRTAHGKFADMAGLLKIEGVDKAKLDEQPEALRFD